MAYGKRISRERSRRRRQILLRVAMFVLIAGGLVGLGYSAYQTGTVLAQSQVTALSSKVTDLTNQLGASRTENEHLQSNLAETQRANLALQNRYDRDVPTDEMAGLLSIARQRVSQGVPAPRLGQALREAAVTRVCDTRFVRKRFAFQVGRSTPEDAATLLDGLIQISATIPSAAADPVRTAAIVIEQTWSSEVTKLTGLPARQDIIVNNLLLHLVVEASPMPGFGMVSLSVCGKG